MITRCGLNRLNQLANLLGRHLHNSKTNTRLLQALVQLDEVLYSGLALRREEEAWALQNGFNLLVRGFRLSHLNVLSTLADEVLSSNPETL